MRNLITALKAGSPVLIEPTKAGAYLERVASLRIDTAKKAEDMTDVLSLLFGEQPEMTEEDGVAVVPIKGVVGYGLTKLERMMGATDIDDIKGWLKYCLENDNIKTVILDVDSPGGTVTGVPECARLLRKLGECKHTIAFTAGEACSAAYWMASQANEFYATPSSIVGSVGVYVSMPDFTRAFEMEGVKMEVIKAGKLKAIGVPGTSLTDEQREHIQQDVDQVHADFREDVRAVRTEVGDESMEGQAFGGKQAAERGLVTGLADDMEEALENSEGWREFVNESEKEQEDEKGEPGEPGEKEDEKE